MLLFYCKMGLSICQGYWIVFQNEKGDNVLVTSVAKGEFYNEYQRIKKKE